MEKLYQGFKMLGCNWQSDIRLLALLQEVIFPGYHWQPDIRLLVLLKKVTLPFRGYAF